MTDNRALWELVEKWRLKASRLGLVYGSDYSACAHELAAILERPVVVGDDVAYWMDRAHAAEDKIASQPLMDACRQCEDCSPYLKEDETPAERIERERKDVASCLRVLQIERSITDIDRLVNRFLAWPIPTSVCPDSCVMNRDYPHRIGTNLLTAEEAKSMFIHALGRSDAMNESMVRGKS